MALVGTVYLPQQNHKPLSKSYHSDVNINLYPGVFLLVSPLQIQGCLTCNNLSNTLKVVTNNGCSWQLPTWKRNLPKVNSLEEVGFLFHLNFELQTCLFQKQFKSACSCYQGESNPVGTFKLGKCLCIRRCFCPLQTIKTIVIWPLCCSYIAIICLLFFILIDDVSQTNFIIIWLLNQLCPFYFSNPLMQSRNHLPEQRSFWQDNQVLSLPLLFLSTFITVLTLLIPVICRTHII